LYLSNLQLQQLFLSHVLPCVVSGSAHTGIRLPSIDQDYAATCSHAVGLLAARGRQHIALLMPRSGQAGNLESERGFLEGIRRYPALRGQIVHHDGTVSGICNLLDRLMRSQSPVDGLLVAKPAHVTTTLTHLLRRGLRLPEGISLLSRDDDPLLETLVPVISRYHLEPGAFARKISRLVLGVLGNSVQANTTVRLMPALIKGETLGRAHSS
jgi:DNA-binding LacI/PurR family transcriptional regulator